MHGDFGADISLPCAAQRYYKAALDYAQMRGEGVNGISTDVALTVTENAVMIKRVSKCFTQGCLRTGDLVQVSTTGWLKGEKCRDSCMLSHVFLSL